MITTIIIILGLLYFIDAIFDKFFIWEKIENEGMKAGLKIIYDLSQCRFCLMFHIAWIMTVFYGAIAGFKTELIIVPFVVLGLTRLKEKI